MSPEELSRGLVEPTAYAHAPERVETLETHISRLFFAGDRVYKVKKPVDLGFLDFRELDRRRHFCEEEVRLNRRLAPEVYLGVVPIVRTPEGLRVGGEGEPIEWAVEMVRLPAESLLDARFDRGEVDNAQITALAEVLARFHAEARSGPEVDRYGTFEAVRDLVLGNLTELERFAGDGRALTERRLGFLRAAAEGFLERERPLLERRVTQGRIRDGHGDLHSGNVSFSDGGIAIYDCIEFSEAFRCGDVAADLAFLAMDLDAHGLPAFARYLVRTYAALTGDRELERMVDFYKAYRALVRAKVACITAEGMENGSEAREEKEREAIRYVDLATAYRLPPVLVMLCGLPATGKTTLARAVARPLGAALHRSDVRRKQLLGARATERVGTGFGRGGYSPEITVKTYRSLLARTVAELREGRSVVVDAMFSEAKKRREFVDAMTRLDIPWCLLWVDADEDVVAARMAERAHDEKEVSDADWKVYLAARERFEPPDELAADRIVKVLSGADSLERAATRVLEVFTDGAGVSASSA